MTTPGITPTAQTYGRTAGIGAAWMMGSTLVGKVASLGSQIVLGWVLSKGDFGLFAFAVSISAVFASLQDGGAQRILVQQGHRYDLLARAVLKLALAFKLAGAVLIAIAAPLVAGWFDSPELPPLLWIMAANLVFTAPLAVFRAKLNIDLRFRTIAQLNTFSAIVRHGSMIAFALAGFGPMSFVLPLLVVTGFEAIFLRWVVGPLPDSGLPLREVRHELLAASKWIIAAAVAGSLILNGDYFVIGAFFTDAVLGVYFFGFQLTASFSRLVTGSVAEVLMPSFTKVLHDPARQRAGFLKVVRLLSLVFAPFCVLLLIIADPFVRVLWAGRWDDAIPIVQLFSIAVLANMTAPLARALMEAHGRWRLRAGILTASSASTILAALLGAMFQDIIVVSLFVTGQRVIMGTVNLAVASHLTQSRMYHVVYQLAMPVLISLVCGACAWMLSVQFQPSTITVFATAVSFASLFVLAAVIGLRGQVNELLSLIARRS